MDNTTRPRYEMYQNLFESLTEKASDYFGNECLSDSEKTNVLLYVQIRMLANVAELMCDIFQDKLR